MKTKKKGFTIVELVIVIAVIAILAAVLIPTFSGIIKKANENTDTQLVRNLNTALALDNKEHKTMQSALDAAKEFGFDLDKINTKANENEILWDSVNDCFVYLKGGKLEYIPDSKKTDDVKKYQLWKIANELPASQEYSIYAGSGWTTTEVAGLAVGFDAGENTEIASVEYVGVGTSRDVVIRTDSYDTTLTVNAPTDTVSHYGEVDYVTINAIDKNYSYHEFGTLKGQINLFSGHLVVETAASVSVVNVKATNHSDFSIESTNNLSFGCIIADDYRVLITNGQDKNIFVSSATSVMNEESQNAEAYSDKLGLLNDWTEALTANGEITILKNSTLSNDYTLKNKINSKINLNKYTINGTNKQITLQDGAYLTLENGNLALSVDEANKCGIMINSAASIELIGVTYKTNGAALFPRGDASTVIVKDSTIEGSSYAVATNASGAENFNVNIKLINSTLMGATPVLLNVPGVLSIDNSDIIGTMHGVIVRGGIATIKNSKINQVRKDEDLDMYNYFNNKEWGQGNTVQLGGLIIGNKSSKDYQYASSVSVEDSEIIVGTAADSSKTYYFPAIYIYGNSGDGNGVVLNTDNVTLKQGEMVVENNYCVINGIDYRKNN